MPIDGGKYEFTLQNLNKAPDKAGVYALFDGNEIIYYGRAQGGDVTIRSRLKDHKSGREGSCTSNASHYMREVTSSPVKREQELLEEYKQTHNGKLPRCNDRVG